MKRRDECPCPVNAVIYTLLVLYWQLCGRRVPPPPFCSVQLLWNAAFSWYPVVISRCGHIDVNCTGSPLCWRCSLESFITGYCASIIYCTWPRTQVPAPLLNNQLEMLTWYQIHVWLRLEISNTALLTYLYYTLWSWNIILNNGAVAATLLIHPEALLWPNSKSSRNFEQ
jgi:hypothetical protein